MGYGFGGWLRAKREAKKLTQAQLGEGLGTDGADASKTVVYGWEKEQHYPRVDQLYLICAKLGCTADALMFGAETPGSFTAEAAEIATAIDSLHGETRRQVMELCYRAISLARPNVIADYGKGTRIRTND